MGDIVGMGRGAMQARLNEDHWTMAILFQRLSEGLSDGLDQAVLTTILDALATMMTEHAVREEEFLAQEGFPDLDRHAREHAQGLADLRTALAECKRGRALTRADVTAISALFTDFLFASDRRDGITNLAH